MRKSELFRFDLRLAVVKNLPIACVLFVVLAAVTASAGEIEKTIHFFSILTACVCLRWFASDVPRWNRYMAWLPDELKGDK